MMRFGAGTGSDQFRNAAITSGSMASAACAPPEKTIATATNAARNCTRIQPPNRDTRQLTLSTSWQTRTSVMQPIHVIGGGLAGSEAAWQIASRGVPVVLHEMRPVRMTDAHKTDGLAELVCSNSFRSDDRETNAVGLLHEEMRRLNSLVMRAADANQVPAGGALAVDRDGFSQAITRALAAHPLIEIVRGEVASP